jgi:hypothetical protein
LGSKRSFSPMFSQLVKTVRENEPQVFIPGAQSPLVPLSGSAALPRYTMVACEPDYLLPGTVSNRYPRLSTVPP